MTDIFFSYSSADRKRVRPIRDALAEQGFEVFWDQQVPAGMDWDSWIRQHLTKSKCAIAFWSAKSVSSDNVRHEAMVAKQQGKLISVLLEPLTVEQFPMGLYVQQAANLSGWRGDYNDNEWRKFRREFEAKLTPPWVRRQFDEIEAELVGERTRREGAERRDRTMQAQITKEVEVQQILKQERDVAFDEVTKLKATVEKLTRAGGEAKAKQAEAQQALKRERDSALDEVAALKTSVEELTQVRADAEARTAELSQRLRKVRQSKAQETARSIGAAFSPFVIAAAVATVGFWTYQLIWSAPQPLLAITSDSTADAETKLKAAEIEQQRLQEEVQGQAKAATELQTKLQAAQAEQQQQARAVVDADSKRKAAEAEQQRLKEEVQRQTRAAADADAKLKAALTEQQRLAKAATDADAKRGAAEAEQQRLAEELRKRVEAAATKQEALPQATSTVMAASFESRPNSVGVDKMPSGSDASGTVEACQERCTQRGTCQAFTFSKNSKLCFLYDLVPTFRSNPSFDSGVLSRK
jgi:TIR domain/PAN domain